MPILSCDVKNCIHNKSNACELNEIAVKGQDANHMGATSCTTFCDTTSCYKHECPPERAESHSNIQCSATNCHYNCEKVCNASDISVSGAGADKAEHTICSTFTFH